MAKKKQEEVEETTAEVTETQATEKATGESNAVSADAATEDAPKTSDENSKVEETEATSVVDSVVNAVTAAAETVAETVVSGVEKAVAAVTGDSGEKVVKTSKRAEKVGVVASDKMTKTVTVRVDRLVKHPIYRKYIKRRKKFMAHDDLGAKVGDKVRIVETRPLSARKRWRVVEIIQRAES